MVSQVMLTYGQSLESAVRCNDDRCGHLTDTNAMFLLAFNHLLASLRPQPQLQPQPQEQAQAPSHD